VTAPVLLFVAGPNGAGKTTFHEAYLAPLGLPYVNADRIARLLGTSDRDAFTVAEGLRTALVEARLSFCTETVFSDPKRAKLGLLREAKARGFAVVLVFIGLAGPMLSVARVAQRVRQGGHDVPEARLHARFPRTLANLRQALAVVDEAFLFDNSSFDDPYRLVAVYDGGRVVSRRPPLPAWTKGLPGL
jgi:predicted ABC-type ATPase